jgi:hypothetical protein
VLGGAEHVVADVLEARRGRRADQRDRAVRIHQVGERLPHGQEDPALTLALVEPFPEATLSRIFLNQERAA